MSTTENNQLLVIEIKDKKGHISISPLAPTKEELRIMHLHCACLGNIIACMHNNDMTWAQAAAEVLGVGFTGTLDREEWLKAHDL